MVAIENGFDNRDLKFLPKKFPSVELRCHALFVIY